MPRKVYAEGDTWTIFEDDDGFHVVDPDWKSIQVSPVQAGILRYPGKNLLVNAGTGFGKDWVGVEWAKKLAKQLYLPRLKAGFRRGGPMVTVAICAPTEPNYLETWDKLKAQIPHVPGMAADGTPNYRVNEGKRKFIQLFGKRGIRFEMVTLFKPDSVRGRGWDICLITEAAFMKKTTFRKVVLKRVNRGGYYGAIMLISTPNNDWWDDACDDAELKKGGEFSTYQYFEATSYDNPLLDEETRAAIKAQEMGNPLEFEQERLAKRHIRVVEGSLDCPFTPGMVECALSKAQPVKSGVTLLCFDLMYGGGDKLCMTAWNVAAVTMVDIQIWSAADLGMREGAPLEEIYGTLVDLFTKQAARWAPARIIYDRQGQFGGALMSQLPPFLNAKAMTRDRAAKNSHVENFLMRITPAEGQTVARGIKLLDPECATLTVAQRANAKTLLEQIYKYRKIYALDKNGQPKIDKAGRLEYYYTKGEGVGDDAIDSVTWACSELPAFGGRQLNQSAMRARVLG
jgi:hypothetical protein